MTKIPKKRIKIGCFSKKILLLLAGGIILSLIRRPDNYFRIVKNIAKEWQKINKQELKKAIKRLYQSKLISFKENHDKTVTLILAEDGKKRILQYNLDAIILKKPSQWDGLWRLVVFDIPEEKRKGRNALAGKLRELGFYPLQKSAFIYPFECKDEIDFITEIFEIVPYVRFLRVKYIDNELDLKHHFKLN